MKQRHIILLALLLVFLGISAKEYRPEDIPNVHVANRTKYVSNPDNVLSSATVAQLDSTLSNLWKQTSAEAVVVVVENIEGGDIDSFATELFSKWGIGKRD